MKKCIYAIITILLISFNKQPIICFARDYQVNSSNTEADGNFWNGWKEFHYGATDVGSKKGDTVTYRTPVIRDGHLSYYESSATMRGYGYYSFDFSKHILGLLSYIKNKVTDYQTDYTPKSDIPEFDEYGYPKELEAVKMREAVNKTITKLVSNWYSTEYEQGEFADFWTKCITNKISEYGNELKKLQNKFYFEAYASNAISKLTSMMGNNYWDGISPNEKNKRITALRGVVFSIMEARYRNKNLQGKANLKLKVSEGDLWPFLVNITNLNKITRNKTTGAYDPAPAFPDFDLIIDGAYQWMYYYDSQINSSTSHSTVTSYMNAQLEEEEETEADWEGEFDALTGDNFPHLTTNAELAEFYTKCSTVRTLFKKSSENAEGIFGAEELYDITSETSYSEAMKKMKDSMNRFAEAAGDDIKKVFVGLTDYNIERTYLMAKNIVENEAIQNEYAYYNIGTNIITFTPGLDGSEYLLIDFQKVKLEEPLIAFNGNRRYETDKDTDKDGILDKLELGDGHSSGTDETELYKKVNITGFIKKMIESELYGDDSAYINSLSWDDKKHYENERYNMIENALAEVKFNIYKKRVDFLNDHSDDNTLDRSEEYEHYLNIDSHTLNIIKGMSNQNEIKSRLKGNDVKLQVELYKYTSNPVLKDTDFDGLDDKFERDNGFNAKSGLRTQNNVNSQVGDGININDTMDYRYFYMSNKYYYDELARMSLIMSNAVSNGNDGVDENKETKDMSRINTAMASIGMNCTYEDVKKDNLKTGLAIGHKEVEYADIKKNIVLIAVSNARDLVEYNSFADVGGTGWSSSLNSNHQKPYEILANEIYNKVKTYLATNSINQNVVYWITGYGTGGGIANILSAKMIDKPLVSTNIKVPTILWFSKDVNTGMTNVYTYTFGAPNVAYTLDEDTGINNNKYKSIFNVVDNNDVSAHMLSTNTGWHKYGWNMALTEKAEKCREIIDEFDKTMRNKTRDDLENRYGNDELTIKSLLEYIQMARANGDLLDNYSLFDGLSTIKVGSYRVFVNKYYAYYKELEQKHKIMNYYNLCKKLLPEHMKVGDGWSPRSKQYMVYSSMKDTLDYMADWYLKNVYTYQVGSYGAKRYRIIYIPVKKKDNILGYILQVNGDQINDSNIIINDYKTNMRTTESFRIVYEQNISSERAKTYLRKGIVQNDENNVTYYTGEQYQNEFKHRFEYYLGEASQEARDSRETFFETKDTENENEKNPELIYNFDSAYDVDSYMPYEKVKRTKRVARGTYKFPYGNKTINVADDCSGFAEAVFIKFLKDNQFENSDKINNLWYGSSAFSKGQATKLLDYGFKCYKAGDKDENGDDVLRKLYNEGLQYGDLVCSNGHVEFYRDDTHSFGWGRTHSDYENEEHSYHWVWSDFHNCLYDSKLGENNKDLKLSTNEKYVAVYRYEE